MRIIQLNLNHCAAAQDLLLQSQGELKADVALLSEPYKPMDSHNWLADESHKAAIWILGDKIPQRRMGEPNRGFTWVKIDGLYIVSCYAPPSMSIEDFAQMMGIMTTELRGKRPVIVAGDYNAWSQTWGSTHTNPRGRIVEETFATMELVLLNEPGQYTFDSGRGRSIIDLAYADTSTANRIRWEISEVYTHSDHHAITIDVNRREGRRAFVQKVQRISWKRNAFDVESFEVAWNEAKFDGESAKVKAIQVAKRLEEACDAAMPRRTGTVNRQPAYWWTEEIAELRRKCIKARRKAQRARGRATFSELQIYFRVCRLALKRAILASKNRCFRELRDSADVDPWGLAYKTVMRKVRGPRAPQPTCPVLLEKVVVELFPPQDELNDIGLDHIEDMSEIENVTMDEILATLSRISDEKAPGPDGVPNAAFKAAVRARPAVFADLYSTCIREGIFPERWKRQRLVLLLKPGKAPDEPSSYRPLCLLDTVGKVLERIIGDRLQEHLEGAGGLCDRQYGFRRARSTVDAIRTVVDIARNATSGSGGPSGTMKYCAVITLDIKNAFNSANWTRILKALKMFSVPAYLLRMIRSYFCDRVLEYDTEEGPKKYAVTGGVPQGSVLGPTLWNAMYDGVLKLELPKDATLVGYADDIALVVVGKQIVDVELTCNDAVTRIQRWLNNAKLELAAQKTEVVLLSSRRRKEHMTVNVGGHDIKSKPAIRYLGVIIDTRITFKDHLRAVSVKAAAVNGALTCILPNIGGPQGARRRLLSMVTDSIVLYAAPIWAGAKHSHLREAKHTQRVSALRVACAYRTVSEEAICVIAGKIPLDIRAQEMQRIYTRQGIKPTLEQKEEQRRQSLNEWQLRWEHASKGRWTFELIPQIRIWIQRKHGEVDFYLTQLLSGHGCFLYYLYRFKLADTPFCPTCHGAHESAKHVLFECERFESEREELARRFGKPPTVENMVTEMCATTEKWDAVCIFAARVMTRLRDIERERKREQRLIQLQQQQRTEVNNTPVDWVQSGYSFLVTNGRTITDA